MSLEDKVADKYGGGTLVSGLTTVTLAKALGAFDNAQSYTLFDTFASYLPNFPLQNFPISQLLDPLVQIGGIGAGLSTSLAAKGQQRTAPGVALGATLLYSAYNYSQAIGVPMVYLATQPFLVAALSQVVLPVVAFYGVGFLAGNIWKYVRTVFRRRMKNQSHYDGKNMVGHRLRLQGEIPEYTIS